MLCLKQRISTSMPPSYARQTTPTSPSPSSYYKPASMSCARNPSVLMSPAVKNWYEPSPGYSAVSWLRPPDQMRRRQQADATHRSSSPLQSLRSSSQTASPISWTPDRHQWLVDYLQAFLVLRPADRLAPPRICWANLRQSDSRNRSSPLLVWSNHTCVCGADSLTTRL